MANKRTRSFSVYVDEPVAVAEKKAIVKALSVLSPSSGVTTDGENFNKENLNPVTGERAGSSLDTGKKRKPIGILAIKAHADDAEQGGKDAKTSDAPRETKKLKPSPSATAQSKRVTRSATAAKRSKKRTKRASSLPKLEEEAVESAPAAIAKAQINSKCYDLTVSPLADVTEAYIQHIPVPEFMDREESDKEDTEKPMFVRDRSLEPQIRDYFDPSKVLNTQTTRSRSREPSAEPKTFSTPERKSIYAAFTFTSPSPVKKRAAA